MEDQSKDRPPEGKKNKISASDALTVVAYPISAAAGLYAAKQNIRDHSSKYHRKIGTFQGIEDLERQTKEAVEKAEATGGNPRLEMAKGVERVEEFKATRFKQMGYKSVLHNFRDLTENGRTEAVVVGLTVTGITLGALLMIANSKNTFDKIFGHADKDTGASKGQ